MRKPSAHQREFERVASLELRGIALELPQHSIPVGYFCPYVPEELIHAAGALPLRLMGSSVRLSHAQAHLPPHCCHLVKSSLESLLRGELDFLKGIIFSHTCDAMQGLSDIWSFQKRLSLQFNFMAPSNLSSGHARPYLKAEMERLKAFLDTNVRKITLQDLKASIHLFNQIREKTQTLYRLRRNSPASISGSEFVQIIRAGYLMDRNRYLDHLNGLLKEWPQENEKKMKTVPVYLTGNMVHSPSVFSLIEEAGASVVFDNLCSGARFLRLMTREEIDPIDALTERYVSSFLCPAKHSKATAHAETLLKEVEETGARGVIFLFYKYCEPHYFDYPDLKKNLEERGMPSLLLEVDDPATSQEQMKVRVQAFVEMLSPF